MNEKVHNNINQCLSALRSAAPRGLIVLRIDEEGRPIIMLDPDTTANTVMLTAARVLNDALIARMFKAPGPSLVVPPPGTTLAPAG